MIDKDGKWSMCDYQNTNINNNTYKHGTEKTTAQTTGSKNIFMNAKWARIKNWQARNLWLYVFLIFCLSDSTVGYAWPIGVLDPLILGQIYPNRTI